jgi:hypothetical protein
VRLAELVALREQSGILVVIVEIEPEDREASIRSVGVVKSSNRGEVRYARAAPRGPEFEEDLQSSQVA